MEGEVASRCSSEDGGGAEELTSLPSEPPSHYRSRICYIERERTMEGEVTSHSSSEDGGGAEELTSLSSEPPSHASLQNHMSEF